MPPVPRHVPAAVMDALLFLCVVATLFFAALWQSDQQPSDRFYVRPPPLPTPGLDRVFSQGELTMITRNTAHSYYLYREQATGFEYDLARAFADFLGVRLTVRLADNWQEMCALLDGTPGGFIAAGVGITAAKKQRVAFSDVYLTSGQHLVSHRKQRRIRRPADLEGRTLHVPKGSPYQERLEQLRNQGVHFHMVLCEGVPSEELIRRVAEQTIDATIADSMVAYRNRRYYPQLMVSEAVSREVAFGWAVGRASKGLLEEINRFFETIKADGRFQEIFDRHYANVSDFDFVGVRAYHRRLKSRLPEYLPTVQAAAAAHGFDWRLVAAQMYQESHFDPNAMSHAGAFGLMQLTRATAESLGVQNILDPTENIMAGVRHMKALYDYFDEAAPPDRLCLALAAYNTGQGHLYDARRLARQMNLDPDKWAVISRTLPLLRYPEYYKEAVYGYCRGTEPVEYVKQTLLYYDILKHKDRRTPTSSAAVAGSG